MIVIGFSCKPVMHKLIKWKMMKNSVRKHVHILCQLPSKLSHPKLYILQIILTTEVSLVCSMI